MESLTAAYLEGRLSPEEAERLLETIEPGRAGPPNAVRDEEPVRPGTDESARPAANRSRLGKARPANEYPERRKPNRRPDVGPYASAPHGPDRAALCRRRADRPVGRLRHEPLCRPAPSRRIQRSGRRSEKPFGSRSFGRDPGHAERIVPTALSDLVRRIGPRGMARRRSLFRRVARPAQTVRRAHRAPRESAYWEPRST